jgi:hypothetical protein
MTRPASMPADVTPAGGHSVTVTTRRLRRDFDAAPGSAGRGHS